MRVGALRLWPAGQREGGDGAPPRGRRPTVAEVRTWVREAGRGVYEIRIRTKRSSANRGPEALDPCPQIQRLYSAVGHPPALRWSQLLEVKVRRRGPPDVDTCGRRLLGRRPAWVGSTGLRPATGLRRHAWGTIGSLRLTAASTSRSASLSHAIRAPLMSHEGIGFPTGCLAGPASGQRQRGQRGPGVRMAGGTLCALYP